jgi:hypothetical protein
MLIPASYIKRGDWGETVAFFCWPVDIALKGPECKLDGLQFAGEMFSCLLAG